MFIARGKEDALVTRNLVPGDAVYGEKRISVDVRYLIFSCFLFIYYTRRTPTVGRGHASGFLELFYKKCVYVYLFVFPHPRELNI